MMNELSDALRQTSRTRGSGVVQCFCPIILVLSWVLSVASGHYTSQWAVHIPGGTHVADRIAAKHGFVNRGKVFEDYYHFEHIKVQKRSLTPETFHHRNLVEEPEVVWAQQQVVKRRFKRDLITLRPRQRADSYRFSDIRWPQMWYLNRGSGLDMNVQPAWAEGVTGKGVVVTILDDGLEKDHPDLMKNYDPQASYDVNNHDEDPMPRYDLIDSNRHGTRCAGEVAAVANNSICSVGVAFGASVGGVRMLDGDVTDVVEARSLSLNPQHIDIYSASWGPDDDGKTVDGPGELATRAFIEGVTKGRQGKGSIFIWASGNGGRDQDNCNCDGYTNSIWTLSISSATEQGLVPWYSEACSSTLATTYSSGSAGEKQIVTTDLHHQCTSGHTGTSASAPLAAGICALALEANSDLTWRDMQHIVVRTAKPANLKSPDWRTNGVGRNVSHSFGYGLMDASAMVQLARTWRTVPEQHRCEVSAPHVDKLIPMRSKVILNLTVTECAGVNFLEHVQAKISLSSSRRGDLQIYLTSPAGTRSTLLAKRPQDTSRNPFSSWPFMTVHTWGEMPFGIWQLEIHNEGRFLGVASLREWSLLFYGTAQMPGGPDPPKPTQKSFTTKTQMTSRKKTKQKSAQKAAVPSTYPTTSSLPLTIVLGPGNQSQTYKVPAAFQSYPKVQQLFPVYVSTSRKSQDLGKSGKLGVGQKAERQDPGSPKPKPKKPVTQNQLKEKDNSKSQQKKNNVAAPGATHMSPAAGNFEGWQMVFYGTIDEPNTGRDSPLPANGLPELSNALASDLGVEADLGNHVDGRGEKDPRHERQRTTTEGARHAASNTAAGCRGSADRSTLCLGSQVEALQRSSGPHGLGSLLVLVLGTSFSTHARDCAPGMILYKGLCLTTCPEKTYQANVSMGPQCEACHYTCRTCVGSRADQCELCFPDAIISESSCYPADLPNVKWQYYLYVALTANIFIFVIILIWLCCQKCQNTRATNTAKYSNLGKGEFELKRQLDDIVYYDSSEESID